MSSHNWSNKSIIVEDTSGYLENLDYDFFCKFESNPLSTWICHFLEAFDNLNNT